MVDHCNHSAKNDNNLDFFLEILSHFRMKFEDFIFRNGRMYSYVFETNHEYRNSKIICQNDNVRMTGVCHILIYTYTHTFIVQMCVRFYSVTGAEIVFVSRKPSVCEIVIRSSEISGLAGEQIL